MKTKVNKTVVQASDVFEALETIMTELKRDPTKPVEMFKGRLEGGQPTYQKVVFNCGSLNSQVSIWFNNPSVDLCPSSENQTEE